MGTVGRRRRGLRALVGVALLVVPLLGGPESAAAAETAVSFGETYSYLVVDHGDVAGFESPAFDDSGFASGQAPFGTTNGTCPWNTPANVATEWPANTDLLLRKWFTLPAPSHVQNLTVAGTVDNNATVYVNGASIGTVTDGFCHANGINLTAPNSLLQEGDNLLAIRGVDLGVATFLDVQVTYDFVNAAPDCSAAAPSVGTLWPPDHGFVDVEVLDVTDPDGDATAVTITGIAQDEAVLARGTGNTAPDGQGVGTSTARVRAERSGREDGRVYHIGFTAEDGFGGSCSGEVVVGVPHDQGGQTAPVDGGALYDSTAA